MKDLEWALADAINRRRIVTFAYQGHPRVVIPAALGRQVSTRTLDLRGFQTGGRSTTGALPAWRTFRVSLIHDLVVTDVVVHRAPPGMSTTDDVQLHPVLARLRF